MMNERLKELAEQAGYVPLEPRTFADDLQDIFLKKFAELIVQECADLCLKHETMIYRDSMEYRKGHHFNTIIKQHFGVEL